MRICVFCLQLNAYVSSYFIRKSVLFQFRFGGVRRERRNMREYLINGKSASGACASCVCVCESMRFATQTRVGTIWFVGLYELVCWRFRVYSGETRDRPLVVDTGKRVRLKQENSVLKIHFPSDFT